MYEDEIPVGRAKDLRGQRFGKLTVLYRVHNGTEGRARWKCKCDCDSYIIVNNIVELKRLYESRYGVNH